MAIYSLQAKVISRGQGHSATAAAAYRARVLLLDERTGQKFDFSRMKNEAVFTGIYAPQDAPAWAIDRQQLWNAVEKAEKRKDAQVARDLTIALPCELTPEQNRWLVQDFVRENFTRKGYVADVAIHAPSEQGDERNTHAHIMVTMRTLGAENFAVTKDRAMNSKEYLHGLRESWEQLANRHLERHGHAERIDRRTLKAQGIERAPELHMGKDATAAERKGRTTERGERQKEIKTRNRRAEELLRELAELQQQQGIAGQFKENAVAWYDRAFDSLTTIAAFPLGFLMGDVMDFKTPTGEEQKTTEITIRTDEVTIQQAARADAPTQQDAQAGAVPEATTAPAQETAQQQAMMERKAFEEAWYRDHSDGREREREQEI
jgi:ATP-dependent exoDNAse (exonuclease V) alpha subunit